MPLLSDGLQPPSYNTVSWPGGLLIGNEYLEYSMCEYQPEVIFNLKNSYRNPPIIYVQLEFGTKPAAGNYAILASNPIIDDDTGLFKKVKAYSILDAGDLTNANIVMLAICTGRV